MGDDAPATLMSEKGHFADCAIIWDLTCREWFFPRARQGGMVYSGSPDTHCGGEVFVSNVNFTLSAFVRAFHGQLDSYSVLNEIDALRTLIFWPVGPCTTLLKAQVYGRDWPGAKSAVPGTENEMP
jgi:hypothetical protein